jgi:hypothetical protein
MRYLRILAVLVVLSPMGAAVQATDSAAPVGPALSSSFPAPVCSALPQGPSNAGLVDDATIRQIVSGLAPTPVPLFCQCHSASQCPRCPPPSQRVCVACLCDCT